MQPFDFELAEQRTSLIVELAEREFYRVIAAKRGASWKRNDVVLSFRRVRGSQLKDAEFPMFRNAFIAAFRALQDPNDTELADRIDEFFDTDIKPIRETA